MLPAQEILPGSPDQSEEEPVMAVASVVREIEAEIAREEERRSREEMILDPASAPEMLPGGTSRAVGPGGTAIFPAACAVHSGRPGCGAGAVCDASARGAARGGHPHRQYPKSSQ